MKAVGIFVIVIAMFGLGGCATPTPAPEKFEFDIKSKPGFTQAQFNIDFKDCDPSVKNPNIPSQLVRQYRQIVISCMSRKGYTEVSPVIETDNIYCMKGDECEDMWAQALAFARRQFSRELFFESDTLIRSTDPAVEKEEFQDGSRRKVSKMIIRRTHLGGGKYEIEFDFKCGTACIVSSSAEMKKDFVGAMKLYQKNRPKTDTSSSPVSMQAAPQASGTVSVEDQLKKLQDMHDKKIITDSEYKAMRAKALGL